MLSVAIVKYRGDSRKRIHGRLAAGQNVPYKAFAAASHRNIFGYRLLQMHYIIKSARFEGNASTGPVDGRRVAAKRSISAKISSLAAVGGPGKRA